MVAIVSRRRWVKMPEWDIENFYDDIIKWKHFPHYWPFVRGIHRSPVDSTHKDQWCRALMLFICAWTNGWANNRDTSDLRCLFTHYDLTVICLPFRWNDVTFGGRADSRFAPSQWETSLQSNAASHWPGANLELALQYHSCWCSSGPLCHQVISSQGTDYIDKQVLVSTRTDFNYNCAWWHHQMETFSA